MQINVLSLEALIASKKALNRPRVLVQSELDTWLLPLRMS